MSLLVSLMFLTLVNVTDQVCDSPHTHTRSAGASASGHFIIGGLFPLHDGVQKLTDLSQPQDNTCTSFSVTGLALALALVHAVERVNTSPLLSRLGVTLGYRIHDTCSDVTSALRALTDFTSSGSDVDVSINSQQCSQHITAVIGALNSETSIAVARELNLYMIPQISYASTADILSDKSRFPVFSRTVPSDQHQTSGMVKLLSLKRWTWVGVVTTDGDYGRSALDSFLSQAFQAGICVAFKEILPDSLTNTQQLQAALSRTVQTVLVNTRVRVIVSFAKPEHMSRLFRGLLDTDMRSCDRRLWIASDNWSTSSDVISHQELHRIGWVVGFSFESRNTEIFQTYLEKLKFNIETQTNNSFLKEFYSTFTNGSKTQLNITAEKLKNSIHAGKVFSIEMAVNAIAQAVAKLCSNRNCTDPSSVQPCELLPELRNRTFEMDGKSYTFDENGDINLGYHISLWTNTGRNINTLNVVSVYHQNNSSLSVSNFNFNVTSRCSDSCNPGQFKKSSEGQHTCCYDCMDCAENQFSNSTDMDQCYSCDSSLEWAPPGSFTCRAKSVEFFSWEDGFAVFLLCMAGVGVLLVLLVSALFVWYRESPVVKAAGGPLCQLILFSLLGSFTSSVFFVGKPTDLQCKTRQVLYGLSFTLCVSCILVKSLKILLAFQMKPALRKLYRPYVIVGLCLMLQGVTCTCWLTLFSPHRTSIINTSSILEECSEGSYLFLGAVLGFTALLALICFILAFRGRKLPEKYNEAKFITFGMLVYLMAWVIFIPVYVTTAGKYLPAVEMVVILISSYSILSCHFLPKCYAFLFRWRHNTREHFLRNVYEYSQKSAGDLHLPQTHKDQDQVYSIPNLFCFPQEGLKQRAPPTAPPKPAFRRSVSM